MNLTIDGAQVVVENTESQHERHTLWSVEGGKAPVLASLVGGPFTMFGDGWIDLTAEDTWTLQHEAEIAMDWKLRLRDVRAVVPPATPGLLRAPASAVVDQINARDGPWEMGFTVMLREAQFSGATTLDAQQIWAGALAAFLKESLRLTDTEVDALKDRARAGLSRFEAFIKKRDDKKAAPDAKEKQE